MIWVAIINIITTLCLTNCKRNQLNRFIFILLISLVQIQGAVRAQTNVEIKSLIMVDSIIGPENTGLYNGTKYIERYRTINERHKFFMTSAFMKGSLVYDNQFYGNVNLKYDLDADDLLLDIGYKWQFPILKLYTPRIKEFQLANKTFINVGNETSDITGGFHELLWSSDNLSLLKKHKKKKYRKIIQTVVYYEFQDDISYFFNYMDTIYPLRKKGDLVNVFPEYKKDLNRLYDTNAIKRDPEVTLISIFTQLQKLMENGTL